MMPPPLRTRFLDLIRQAVSRDSLVKLTLGAACGPDATLKNVFVRPISLRAGPRLSFVFHHATRDVTRNFTHEEGLSRIGVLLGDQFRSANLFTTGQSAQLELPSGRPPRLTLAGPVHESPPDRSHDRAKRRWIDPKDSPWLAALGVTTGDGKICAGMEAKFRQINKFIELLQSLLRQSGRAATDPLTLVDMGCGKGYLTFAAADLLLRNAPDHVTIRGIELRPELVALCNQAAHASGFGALRFQAGTIESTKLDRVDVLVALHACDTATDDALAKGVRAGAMLMLAAPCCHKEIRPQLIPPPALAPALRHGILRERQAEFVTDALRAALLEWAGYDTRVFEFVSTEHTAKNVMIAALKRRTPRDLEKQGARARDLASFYGIRSQRLAAQLGFDLAKTPTNFQA